jgi:hypothetical protein
LTHTEQGVSAALGSQPKTSESNGLVRYFSTGVGPDVSKLAHIPSIPAWRQFGGLGRWFEHPMQRSPQHDNDDPSKQCHCSQKGKVDMIQNVGAPRIPPVRIRKCTVFAALVDLVEHDPHTNYA